MHRFRFRLLILSVFIGHVFILPAYAGYPQTITTTTPFVNLPRPSDDPRWAKAFAHWDKRGDVNEASAAVKIFESLATDKPKQFGVQLWLARSYYLMAIKTKSMSKRDVLLRKSVAAADRALKIKPDDEFAISWKFSAILHLREITNAEYAKLRQIGKKYMNTRGIVVPKGDPLWKEAMAHWDARYQREEGLKAIDVFKKIEKKYPNRIEPKMWLCRSHYWMHFIEPTEKGKAMWLKVAADWGRKAMKVEPLNAAANYWMAASIGQYASHTSFSNMVKHAVEIVKALQLVMEEDPQYFYGGVSQYLALAFARAGPLVAKSLEIIGFSEEVALRSTRFAAKYQPHYLRNFYAQGEMYVKQGKKDEARRVLQIVLNSDPTVLKLQEPENRVAQDLAKKLIREHLSK